MDAFLVATTTSTGRLDTRHFPAQYASHLADAIAYLRESPTFRAGMRRLAESRNVVQLQFHPAHTKYLFHNPRNLRLQWNPFLALHDVTGVLTPALLLAHELGHAQFTQDERKQMRRCDRPNASNAKLTASRRHA